MYGFNFCAQLMSLKHWLPTLAPFLSPLPTYECSSACTGCSTRIGSHTVRLALDILSFALAGHRYLYYRDGMQRPSAVGVQADIFAISRADHLPSNPAGPSYESINSPGDFDWSASPLVSVPTFNSQDIGYPTRTPFIIVLKFDAHISLTRSLRYHQRRIISIQQNIHRRRTRCGSQLRGLAR